MGRSQVSSNVPTASLRNRRVALGAGTAGIAALARPVGALGAACRASLLVRAVATGVTALAGLTLALVAARAGLGALRLGAAGSTNGR